MGKEEFFRSRIKNNKFDQRIISKNKKEIGIFFIQASPSEKIKFKNS